MDEDAEYQQLLKERMEKLPKVVQDAIVSADISKHLRELADTHQLHLDQWEALENEVRMTLLGVKQSDDLAKNIESEVGVSSEVAESLADDVSNVVFEPIRKDLERQLEHPDAQAKETSGAENVAAAVLSTPERGSTMISALPAAPLAPLPSAPEAKAVRAPISEAYKPGETSTARKDVHDDPYREPPK